MFSPHEIEWFSDPIPGRVEETVATDRVGRVRFQSTAWFARLAIPEHRCFLRAGSQVVVLGREGITTLLVMPIDYDLASVNLAMPVSRPPENPDRHWFQWLRLA